MIIIYFVIQNQMCGIIKSISINWWSLWEEKHDKTQTINAQAQLLYGWMLSINPQERQIKAAVQDSRNIIYLFKKSTVTEQSKKGFETAAINVNLVQLTIHLIQICPDVISEEWIRHLRHLKSSLDNISGGLTWIWALRTHWLSIRSNEFFCKGLWRGTGSSKWKIDFHNRKLHF